MADDTVQRVCFPAVALLHTAVLLAKLLRSPAAHCSWLTQTCCGHRSRTKGGGGQRSKKATDRLRQRSKKLGCGGQRPKKSTDRQQKMLAQRLDEIRVQSFLDFIQVWMQVSGALGTLFVVRLMAGLPRIGSGPEAVISAASYMTSFVLSMCPALVNARTLWLVYCVFEAPVFGVGVYYALADPNLFASHYTLLLLYRVSLSIAYPMASFYMPANLLWGMLSTVALVQADVRDRMPISNIVGNEIIIAAFMSYLVWKFGSLQTSQIRSDLAATGHLKSKKTMERLLANMCDAVVELDPNMEIKEACPKLANLLLRHDTANALQGERLTNLMFKEADRDQFDDFVARRAVPLEHDDELGDADHESMYLNLRDAYGTPVCVQLFHSCHQTPPDQVCHIVGVHEVERDTGAGVARDTFGVPEFHADPDDGTESVCSAASMRSWATSDTPIVLAPLIPEQKMKAAASLLFNPIKMEIVACTMGLKSLTGPLVYKGSLKDCIVNYFQFCEWVKVEVNNFLNDDFFTGEHSKFQLTVESPTYRKHANLQYDVDAYILEVEEDANTSEMGVDLPQDCDDESHQLLCVLEFRDAEPRWRRAKRKPRRKGQTHPRQGAFSMAL